MNPRARRGRPGRLGPGRPRRGHPPWAEHGAVTAELAVLLPGVVLIVLALLAVAGAGVAAVQVTDAARAAARAAALGEDAAVVVAVGRQLAGDHAQVHLSTDADLVVVTVTRRLPGPLGAADLTARATARARPEPGR